MSASPQQQHHQQQQHQQQHQQQQQQQGHYFVTPQAQHQQNLAGYHQQLATYYTPDAAPPGFPPPPQQPVPPPSGWTEHLFYTNGKGTPAFEALMKEFFVRLDPTGTGYITPEAFSSFLEVSGVKAEDDICKFSLPKSRIPGRSYDQRGAIAD